MKTSKLIICRAALRGATSQPERVPLLHLTSKVELFDFSFDFRLWRSHTVSWCPPPQGLPPPRVAAKEFTSADPQTSQPPVA
jgi:hypothetical protein